MHISRRSAAVSTVIALLIAITTLTATASTPGTQFAFLDQVKEYFGLSTTDPVVSAIKLGNGSKSTISKSEAIVFSPQTTDTFTTAGTTNWTCPAGVTSVQVEAWGGGGSGGAGINGGGTTTSSNAGGGGGGAYVVSTIAVTPGNSYSIVVGAGGAAGTTSNPGVDSTFATTSVVAKGGAAGASVNGTSLGGAGGAGGSAAASIGDTKFSGGNGFSAVAGTGPGGGGGSSAGTAANGNNATSGTGASAPTGGGAGGNGASSSGNGVAASSPGGGGGGAKTSSSSQRNGGAGGTGKVVLTYTAAAASGKIAVTLPGQSWTSGTGNSGSVSAQTAGTSFNITLTATLSDGITTDTTYSGAHTISYSGPGGSPTYTTNVNFTNGQATALATTLTLAQTTTITATDGTLPGVASSSLVVNPGAIASYVVAATSPQQIGSAFLTTVTAKDANSNTVTTDSATIVTMTSASGNMQFDSNGDSTFGDNTKTLASGTFTVSTKDAVGETTTITATDGNGKTGTSGNVTVADVSAASDYFRSAATGVWGTAATWESSHDGSTNWITATLVPDTSATSITIRSGHNVTVSVNRSTDDTTVDSGGTLTVSSGITLTIADGAAATDLLANGIVVNSGVVTPTGTVSFGSGSKYQHAQNGGLIPTATWNVNSTVEITGVTTSQPSAAGLGQTFGNFIWNSSLQSQNVGLGAPANFAIAGDLTVTNTGGVSNRAVRFTSTGNYALSVGGNLILNGGHLGLSSGAGTMALTVGGSVSISNSSEFYLNQGAAGTGTLNVAGDFSVNTGTVTETGSGTAHSIVFNKTGTQTFTASSAAFLNDINYAVNSGSTLLVNGALPVTTGRTFTVNSGGTLGGTGAISGGSVVVNGTIAPGSSVGTLGSGNVTFNTGSALNIEVGPTTATADQLNVIGTVTLTGGAPSFSSVGGYVPQAGDTFVIVNNDLADAVSGTFATSVFPGFLGTGLTAVVAYNSGGGNDIVVNVVAPPTVTSVNPTSGPTAGGTSVVITGTNFTGATAVAFGGTAAASFNVDSATQITATTAGHAAGAVSVDVTAGGVTNAPNTLYTYALPPDTSAPIITYTPLTNTTSTSNPTLFPVTITDNVGVVSATLYADIDGNGFVANSCTLQGGTAQNGTWSCPIGGALTTPSVVKYYISASDAAPNTATNPTGGASAPNLYAIGAAAVPAGTYTNISLGNGSSIGGAVTVNGNLDLGGVVTTGANVLSLGCTATTSGGGSGTPGNYVDGNLLKNFCSTSGPSFIFPVGQNGYTPLDLANISSVEPVSLTVKSLNSRDSIYDPAQSLNRTWDIVKSGAGSITTDLTFHYKDNAPGDTDVVGTEANYHLWKWVGGFPTDVCACVNAGANTLSTTGVSSFSRWTGAGPLAPTGGSVSIGGRVLTADGQGVYNARITVNSTNSGAQYQGITNPFGYFTIDGLNAGETVVVTVSSKRFIFAQPSKVMTLNQNAEDLIFTANPNQ